MWSKFAADKSRHLLLPAPLQSFGATLCKSKKMFCTFFLQTFSLVPIKWHICILLGNALVFIASGGRFGVGPYRTGESIQPNCFQPWKWVAPAWLNSSTPFWWHGGGGGWHLKGCWLHLFYFRDKPQISAEKTHNLWKSPPSPQCRKIVDTILYALGWIEYQNVSMKLA